MIYMFHSVGNTHTDWIYKILSIKLIHIEKLFQYLNKNKIKTYFVTDLYDNDFKVPSKGICLTFDDGYLDNWVYLFPLLKKYNLKATFFVNPEFADPKNILREQFDKELIEIEQDKALGFLSWQEMIEMEKSGLVDIQSHSMSHTWHHSNPKLIDFFSPLNIRRSRGLEMQYPWVSWNENPEQKPYTHNTYAFNSKRYGLPLLENGRSLGIKRFFIDEDINESILKFTSKNPEIFDKDWYNILYAEFNQLTLNRKEIGQYENEEEQLKRYWYELKESKNILEKRLNKEITILCWPGGIYNDKSVTVSMEAGYFASTVYSRDKTIYENSSKKYKRIQRKHMSANIGLKGKGIVTSNIDNYLIYRYFESNFISDIKLRSEKLLKLMAF